MMTYRIQCVVVFALLALCVRSAEAGYAEDVLALNPVSYWRLEEGSGDMIAIDAVGTGNGDNPGSYSGAVTRTEMSAVEPVSATGAASFDALSEYVTINNESSFDFDQDDAISVVCWVKTSQSVVAQIVNKLDGLSGWCLGIASGEVQVQLANNATHVLVVRGSSSSINNSEWHMVAWTYDRALGTPTDPELGDNLIFVDGLPISTTAVLSSLTAGDSILNNQAVTLGRRGNGTQPYVGVLDEVAVFNSALTAGQIQNLYDARLAENSFTGYPAAVVAKGPLAYWRLGETNGAAIAEDEIGMVPGLNPGAYTGAVIGGVSSLVAKSPDNTAVSFATANDYISVQNESAFDFDESDPFSVVGWFKTSQSSGVAQVINKLGTLTGWSLGLNNGRPQVQLASSALAALVVRAVSSIADGEAHFVAWTYDRTLGDSAQPEGGDIALYIDGAAVGFTTVVDTLDAGESILNNDAVTFGRRANAAADYQGYVGVLDEVAIFTNALTATEVEAIYSAAFMKGTVVLLR